MEDKKYIIRGGQGLLADTRNGIGGGDEGAEVGIILKQKKPKTAKGINVTMGN